MRPPVILFTAIPSPAIVERALAAGADAVLSKPATREEIVQTAGRLLSRPSASPSPNRLDVLLDAIGADNTAMLLADAQAELPTLVADLFAAATPDARHAAAHRLQGFASHLGLAELEAYAAQAPTTPDEPTPSQADLVSKALALLKEMRSSLRTA